MGCPVVAPGWSDPELGGPERSITPGNGLNRGIPAGENGRERTDDEVPDSEIYFSAQPRTQGVIMATGVAKDLEISVTALTAENAGVPRGLERRPNRINKCRAPPPHGAIAHPIVERLAKASGLRGRSPMGPPPFGDGNARRTVRSNRKRLSFNGAATELRKRRSKSK